MKKIRIVAVIPARMDSSRYPGKPLLNIEGLPMIEHVRRRVLLCDKFTIIMKFYKLIIFIGICMSMIKAQFTDISINIDYSNINENEMFIFQNFDEEIKNYFLNNYFFDEKADLELIIDINMII